MDLTATSSAPSMRIRAWPGDRTVAHLVLRDHALIPSPDEVAEWSQRCRVEGYSTVRTGALSRSAADAYRANGYHTIDRLALLSIDLPTDALDTTARRRGLRRPTRPMRVHHRAAVVDVDQRSFGPVWGHDLDSIVDIEHATPEYRSRIIGRHGRVVAFAISGRSRRTGYLQRLAVDPNNRRQGLARTLVLDALSWMSNKVDRAFVNTGVDNAAARALYLQIGFAIEPDELVVLERSL